MNLQIIKKKVEEKNYPGGFKGLAETIGMTVQNLHRCVRENKIQAQDLEKIAHELGVHIGYFFDEEQTAIRTAGRDYVERGNIEHNGPEHTDSAPNDRDTLLQLIEQLKSQLADKERIIKLLERQ